MGMEGTSVVLVAESIATLIAGGVALSLPYLSIRFQGGGPGRSMAHETEG